MSTTHKNRTDDTLIAQRSDLLKPDKTWFGRNPRRRYRFRSMTPEEQFAFPGPDSIVLHLLDSGEVVGMPLLFGRSSIEDIEDESFSKTIFKYATYLQEPGVDQLEAISRAVFVGVRNEKV